MTTSAKRRLPSRLLLCVLCLLCFVMGAPAAATASGGIAWSQEELDFMAAHPDIRLGVDPTFVPYEFIDTDGVYKGIAADYIELISKATGLTMTVAKGLTWAQAYEKAVGRELDVLPCVAQTAEREKYFLFSKGYYPFQRVIFINESTRQIKSFDDLKGRRVAVQANSSHHSFLMDYPTISLALFTTAEAALHAVSDGTEIAFVGNLSTSSYLIKKYGITNLRYITISSQEPQQLHFAVRSDWPVLVGILNKALDSIVQEDRIAISNKWISIQADADYSALIQTVLIVGGLVALVWTVSLFWILRLRKEVARRKKAQEEAGAAKTEAEQANQVKSLFLARMSHEIRTPLSAIMGMAYLIKKTELTATQSNYLEKLNQSARNMLGIINDILDFSKIESGKIEIEKISFDLDKLLQRITNIISVKVDDKEIEFFIRKAPEMPTLFLGDPTRIEQILLNLVNNAVKFTEQGNVSLTVQAQPLSDQRFTVTFRVQDTGIGMSEEQAKRLFVPFDQGDSSISRRFGGTGLGLSIVKNLTELMGGQIDVQSELGKGSVFTVQLPLEADPNQMAADSKKMAADCFRNVRALVLDASENTRNMLSDYLRAFSIEHSVTADEADAVQRMRKAALAGNAPYNLLIVDYMTPQDGGIAFLERIRKAMYFPRTAKCMLMVPMTREDLLENITAYGIDFGFPKPIVPSTLYNGIVELFRIDPPKKDGVEAAEETPMAPCPYHILLVEDNKTNQFIAQSILTSAGFTLSVAGNGQEGLDFFLAHREAIDLILMDIHMPVMDGYTATDLIRKEDLTTPIIAMTADAVVGVEEKCRSHGINYYVSKPFEPEAFIHTILEALKGKPCRAQSIPSPERADVTENTATATVEPAAPAEPAPAEPTEEGPEVDSARAMRQLGIDAGLYASILREYLNENAHTGQELQAQIDGGDFAQAAHTVHKVKSSSGSLGATRLATCAERLQKALQENDRESVPAENAQFQRLLATAMQEMQQICDQEP
ncbi:MAG: transporter substrate-binding domain-containing protein [Candidatus Limiplasma sp.]|nr:transporter substrate-binding domain-containing protein [Candidatus Limiplasma sp.]